MITWTVAIRIERRFYAMINQQSSCKSSYLLSSVRALQKQNFKPFCPEFQAYSSTIFQIFLACCVPFFFGRCLPCFWGLGPALPFCPEPNRHLRWLPHFLMQEQLALRMLQCRGSSSELRNTPFYWTATMWPDWNSIFIRVQKYSNKRICHEQVLDSKCRIS